MHDPLEMVEDYLHFHISEEQAGVKVPEGLPQIKKAVLDHLDDLVALRVIPGGLTPVFDQVRVDFNPHAGVQLSFPDDLVNYFDYLIDYDPLAYFLLRNLYLQGSLDV